MALASGLLVVIPDNDGDVYAVSAAGDEESPDGAAAALVGDEGTGGDDGTSSTTPTLVREVAGDTGESSAADRARLALATEAALAGAAHSQTDGLSTLSFTQELEAARAAAAAFADKASPAGPTTVAPSTTAPAATSAPQEPETAADEESTTTADPDDGSTTSETAGTESTTTTSTATGETTPAGETSTSEATSETTVPDTTVPETTAAPETVAPVTTAAGWVDSGNGVLMPAVLLAIRYCESRDNYTAANPASSARGAYQFLTGSWAGYGHKDRYGVNQAHLATRAQQDEAAVITWERDGTRPWNASKSCWSKRI
ncbi:MAG: transglycosylase family protein [Acidimicrobiales bacterium]